MDDEVKEVLTQSLDKILNVFQQENCLNLRSFQAALLTLIRIWNLPFDKSINPLDRQQLLEDLFVAILHSTIQQRREVIGTNGTMESLMLNVPILKGRLPLPDIFLALSSLRTTYLSPPSTVKMSYPPLIRMFKTKLLSQEKKVMIPFRKQLNFG